jgi:hypothetical protein
MDNASNTKDCRHAAHPAYAMAFADLERRAARGELSLSQVRREVWALRERYTAGQPVALQGSGRFC